MVANLKIKRSYLFFPDKEKEGDGYKPDAKLRFVFVGRAVKSISM